MPYTPTESQGQLFPVHHQSMVQAAAGYPTPLAPFGSPDGIGAYSLLNEMPTPDASSDGIFSSMLGSPLLHAARTLKGLGDTTVADPNAPASTAIATTGVASPALVAGALLGIVIGGVGGYYAGKAMAPSREKQPEYAWWGVVAGLLGGPIGLGIEGMVALSHKG